MKWKIMELVSCAALVWVVGTGEAAAQEADWTGRVQTLTRMAYMGPSVAEKLERIAGSGDYAAEIRQAAQTALEKKRAGTNSLESIAAFLAGWSVTNEPAIDLATIGLMDEALEFGASAKAIMEADAADAGMPSWYRTLMGQLLQGVTPTP